MKNNLAKYGYLIGIIGMVIQSLLLILKTIDNNMIYHDVVGLQQKSMFSVILSETWPALAGTVLAVIVFFMRVLKGNEPILELVAVMLWGIQLLSKYSKDIDVALYSLSHIFGIIGALLVLVIGILDMIEYKKTSD